MNRPLTDVALAPIPVQWDADHALTAMYGDHYGCLVRLAWLLVQDVSTAEDVVQDSFVAMHTVWRRLRDGDRALVYLHQSVVNRSRSVRRHRAMVGRNASQPGSGMPSAEPRALPSLEHAAVVRALRSLPARQREALALKYYGNLSEAQVASAMGVSQGAVKRHVTGAIAALRVVAGIDP
ncbi:MAG TPA: SigE family RNA polymerase sigma factor [Streptosporangiaceae bacterium]